MIRPKTLQKLTNNTTVSALLKSEEPISQEDIDKLSLRKKEQLQRQINAKLAKLKGEDRDKLISGWVNSNS